MCELNDKYQPDHLLNLDHPIISFMRGMVHCILAIASLIGAFLITFVTQVRYLHCKYQHQEDD